MNREMMAMARSFWKNSVGAMVAAGLIAACGGVETPEASAQAVDVVVEPSQANLPTGGSAPFSAAVTGSTVRSVTWTVTESSGGSVSSTGLYTAPGATGTFHVVATSVADPSVSATAVVTVSSSGGGTYALPADRATVWSPGVPGGVPTYSRVQATLNASTYGNGSSDSRSAIQSALNAAGAAAAADGVGRVVQLSAGVFRITDTLQIPSRVVLRGAGPGSTQITPLSSTLFNIIQIGNSPWPGGDNGMAGSTNLTADGLKGSSSVTVSSTTGLSAGMLVLVDEVSDPAKVWWHPGLAYPSEYGWFCRTNRPISQVVEIASVSGNVVTFKTPLHIDFRTSFSAQVSRFSDAPVWDAGVEELRASRAGAGSSGNTYYNFHFALAGRSWLKHVEGDDMYGSCVFMTYAYRSEVRDSYFHDAHVFQNGGFAYGIDVTQSSSDNLIENNIAVRFNKVMNMRSAGGGNVVAYNYTDDGGIYNYPQWVETGLQASHYPCTQHVLFEGNYSFNADGDSTEGNAIYLVFFRNHLSCARRLSYDASDLATMQSLHPASGGSYGDADNVRCAGAMRSHWWYSFIGNVLGRQGVSYAGWLTDDRAAGKHLETAIWHLGTWDQDYVLLDTKVPGTMIRDGNFDYKSGTQTWYGLGDAGSTAATLPSSLYLGAKPAFFGSNPWPWVTPEGTTKTFTLPAKARYDAGTPNG
jgi:hypothetical protein